MWLCHADKLPAGVPQGARLHPGGLFRRHHSRCWKARIETVGTVGRRRPLMTLTEPADRIWSECMEYDDVILGRRSIRGYKPDPVPRALIEEIIGLAMR